ncbi:MAG: NAD(P)-dependent oxidoreductase [Hyphomicrobiaceae bacterium]
MMSETVKAGMIGLGIMGTAISSNMIAGGLDVVGFDPDEKAISRLRNSGGKPTRSAGEVAALVDVVLTSLPSTDALRDVAQDIRENGRAGCVVAECGTLPIEDKRAAHDLLAEVDIVLLDCPLSGTGAQAANKDLVVFASGDESSVSKCLPVFDAMSRETRYLGPFGNGMKMKLVANLLVSIHNVAAAEALVLARKAGLDPQMTFDVLCTSAASSRMLEVRGPMMVERHYEPATMKNDVWRKDIELISAFARGLNCPSPLFSVTDVLYASARGQGMDKLDTASVNAVLESLAGLSQKG